MTVLSCMDRVAVILQRITFVTSCLVLLSTKHFQNRATPKRKEFASYTCMSYSGTSTNSGFSIHVQMNLS